MTAAERKAERDFRNEIIRIKAGEIWTDPEFEGDVLRAVKVLSFAHGKTVSGFLNEAFAALNVKQHRKLLNAEPSELTPYE
jgi:hypothetical protein